jgi:hypothetical protein
VFDWATDEAKATKELPFPTLSPVNPNVQETIRSAITPSMTKASSAYVSPYGVVAESSEKPQMKTSHRHTKLASIPESSSLRQESVASTDYRELYRTQAQNSRGGSSAGNSQSSVVYINGNRVSPLYDDDDIYSYPPTSGNSSRFSAHSPPVPAPPANTPNSYYEGIAASGRRTVTVDELYPSNRRREPIILDERPYTPRPWIGVVEDAHTMDDTRTTKKASGRASGYHEERMQRRRKKKREREDEQRLSQQVAEANAEIISRSAAEVKRLEEAEQNLRQMILEANAKIALPPAAPAPPNPDRGSEEIYQNRSQELVKQLQRLAFEEERLEDRARRLARQEEKQEEEVQRERLRQRMQPRRRLTTSRDSRRLPEFSYSEGLYRYSDDKPDGNGESSEQKGRPNASADESRYRYE